MAAPLRAAASSAASTASTASTFVPRAVFEVSHSIPRSYFLGHHQGALTSMRKILSNISLILECRDSRVPFTSTNPLLESSLAGRDRVIVYTKWDLSGRKKKESRLLNAFHTGADLSPAVEEGENAESPDAEAVRPPALPALGRAGPTGITEVVFTEDRNSRTIQALVDAIKTRAAAHDSLTGLRALVVGMPNAGKSTLLNALRRVGMAAATAEFGSGEAGKIAKAARTGAQPGVTRKLSTPVRVIPADVESGIEEGVFVVDTPGVFVPYVSDVEAMLKLSLAGCVKDGVVPLETVADYLLFHLNLRDPTLYRQFSAPTNDVRAWLDAIATRTGKLLKGGVPARPQAADWIVQQWRKGNLGRFSLDEVNEESLRTWRERMNNSGEEKISMNQARKREKERRKERSLARKSGVEAV